MRTLLLALIASLCLMPAARAADGQSSVDVGGKNIAVPLPPGLVDAAAA